MPGLTSFSKDKVLEDTEPWRKGKEPVQGSKTQMQRARDNLEIAQLYSSQHKGRHSRGETTRR